LKQVFVIFLLISFTAILTAQPWLQNEEIFNSSGVPSLSFSQPRFADLDSDGDHDMILGNINDAPFYIENIGTATSPDFTEGEDIFSEISSLDAEMGVCADIDNDGDLDLVTGGYNGLKLFENIGTASIPSFQIVNNFFSGLNTGQNPVPDLADVDGDEDLDMVVGHSEDGLVMIYINTGTEFTAQFSESNTIEIGDVGLYAYPNFCDLDDDGDEDIVVGRDSYGFIYYQNNGTPQSGSWEVNAGVFNGIGSDTYWNSPGLQDINGDGTLDLIYGTAAGPLRYYENSGTPSIPSWQENTALFGGVIDVGGASNPVFYDFDDDGDLDMISGSNLGNIKYFENVGTSYAPAWAEDNTYFSSIDHSIYSAITLGDVDNDGLADAVVGDLSGNFYFHHNTGSGFEFIADMLSFVSLGGWSAPRLVDMDADNDLDIVAGNEDGELFYFENQGSINIPDWVEIADYFGAIDVGSNCVPSLGDLNLNGNLDLITGDMWGELQFFIDFHGAWTEDPEVISGISGEQNTTPALADLDNDGDLDLTLGNYDGSLTYYENLHFIVDINENIFPVEPLVLTNYPNPFKPAVAGRGPATTISFQLSEEVDQEDIELTIYNIKGRKIKDLTSILPITFSSSCSVTWNGTDDTNQPVSSGIYFYKLKAGDNVLIRKMLLLR